ncbi:MAG TPA: hypothetical protein EYN66_19150, partial [Myxococcales bacterium]|nr:hypothetical protein [Myxococcales bacterium]
FFGHEGSKEHYRRLKTERKLYVTQCDDCGESAYPSRSFCPDCFSQSVSWVEVGEGATLYAFTTQSRALRFMTPAVIGVVELPNVGFITAPISGSMEDLHIGQALTLEVIDMGDDLTIHQFVPAREVDHAS